MSELWWDIIGQFFNLLTQACHCFHLQDTIWNRCFTNGYSMKQSQTKTVPPKQSHLNSPKPKQSHVKTVPCQNSPIQNSPMPKQSHPKQSHVKTVPCQNSPMSKQSRVKTVPCQNSPIPKICHISSTHCQFQLIIFTFSNLNTYLIKKLKEKIKK